MFEPFKAGGALAPLWSRERWMRRVALWGGAVAVAVVALIFARAADAAFGLFSRVIHHSVWWALLLTPTVFAALAWLTNGALKPTRGSGIPQVIAALQLPDREFRRRNLSLGVSAGKLALTVLALFGGASVGREGPTVHVGASLMYVIGRALGFKDPRDATHFLLAGGAAGIAAAFNTPLAGVVFAIEELSGRFEHTFSGTLLTAVIVGGVVSLGLLGAYTYFGTVQAALPLGLGWLAVLLCGAVAGLLGGVFSRMILAAMDGRPRWLGRMRAANPVLFAGGCGLVLALLGIVFGAGAFGTGYEQARSLVQDHAVVGHEFGLMKFAANLVSYVAGIPGGLFSPALAVGAGIGHNLAVLLPGVDPSSMVLLGMCAYLTGVTQAPLTSSIICLELTDNSDMMLPILATALLARGASALVCRKPVYKALADRLLALMPEPAPPAKDEHDDEDADGPRPAHT
ncbi:chloride channel protein [Pseudoxanthomonas winnipegensis]|jgi:H+/Cl- antiporter ClcA|uniref:Chloride channel protein n=1 Tax=Pseudoxanthomonas winnipegensis TaxID=2480810 RepID=A0A4Q8LYK1_9GAMM|nr:chloride channel protein [Pseudoxanthomonas winnipegensis]RZZ90291.1 chloride channel protein [Pseudoxanthomonas winnipegensis]TAA08839.1 chloride channel protein [Pseudoxanthomonas winnipegensis]TAA20539.1 chloride channel protein [Pseudoxanthomonas winnipegensis]TAA37552.1 chloride channel protein [Pseudoxanthomonas winnipegensis]TAH71807.1 chloride channel protein [Pseudoxanthomonas winnipegensis]